MASTKEKLMSMHVDKDDSASSKVSVVGVGQVGMACAFSLLVQVKLIVNFFTSRLSLF